MSLKDYQQKSLNQLQAYLDKENDLQQGRHSIPETVIRRRFVSGLHNFEQHYKHAVNAWVHHDNSEDKPLWLASGENQ